LNFNDIIVIKKYLFISVIINIIFGFNALVFYEPVDNIHEECKKKIITVEKEVYIEKYIENNQSNKNKKILKRIENKNIDNEQISTVPLEYTKIEKENNNTIIASSTDRSGKYTITLSSEIPLDKKSIFERKIIIYGMINDGETSNKFTIMFPPSILKNLNLLSLKVINHADNNSYVEVPYFFIDMQSGYNYNIEINYSNGIDCYITSTIETVPIENTFNTNIETIRNLKMQKDIKR